MTVGLLKRAATTQSVLRVPEAAERRNLKRIAVVTALMLGSVPAPLAAQEYGNEPSWDEFRQIAEPAVIARLIDPESARLSWMSGIHRGEFKPLLEKKVYGYMACGVVNARNQMGGYAGARSFAVVVNFGEAIHVTIDTRERGTMAKDCAKAVNGGFFPRAPDNGAALGSASQSTASTPVPETKTRPTASGLLVRPMQEGAYIAAVSDRSPAASIGLTPGMVIASVNGIPLSGMGDAMIRVLEAVTSNASFTLVGGKTVRLP